MRYIKNTGNKTVMRVLESLFTSKNTLIKCYKETISSAFTLSEVLITLLILGVVSSLVIPSIINSTKEMEYNVGAKKAMADLTSALSTIVTNNGGIVHVGNDNQQELRNDFCSVMKCIKIDTIENTFGMVKYNKYKSGSSTWPASGNSTDPAVILSNGNLVQFVSYENCTYGSGVNACGFIYFDINGQKGPRMWGRDLYGFWITLQDDAYQILPIGTQGDGLYCTIGAWENCTGERIYNPDHMP